MMRLTGLLLASALIVSACSAPAPVAPAPEAETAAPEAAAPEAETSFKPEMDVLDRVQDSCGMAALQPYVGKKASEIPADMLPDTARVVSPTSNVTMDYVESRLNVLTDEAGTIIGLKCG